MSQDSGHGRTLSELAALVKSAREFPTAPDGKPRSIDVAAEDAGLSHMTWRRVEEASPVRSATYFAVERTLGWGSGSIRAYLDHGTIPERLEAPANLVTAPTIYEASFDELAEEMKRRYRYASEGAPGRPAVETEPDAARSHGGRLGRPMRRTHGEQRWQDDPGPSGASSES